MSNTFRSRLEQFLRAGDSFCCIKCFFVTSPATEDEKPVSHEPRSWLGWSPPSVYQNHINRYEESLGGEWSGPVFMGSVLDPSSEAAKYFPNSSALLEEVLGFETHLQPNVPR